MVNHFSALAYPLLVWLLYVWTSLFAMIIDLLMWVDVRNPWGQRENGDFDA